MRRFVVYIAAVLLVLLPVTTAAQSAYMQTRKKADSLYNSMHFREAYNLYRDLFESREVQQDVQKKLAILNDLCDASDLVGEKNDQMHYLQQMLDLSLETGNDYYHSWALMMMGKRLYYEGKQQQGIDYVEKAVALMSKTDSINTDHQVHCQLNVLITMYSGVKEPEQILAIDRRNVKLTREGTRWGKNPQTQLIDQRVALAKYASSLAHQGYYEQADSAYEAWKAVPIRETSRNYFIVDYLRTRGRYQEAINVYTDLIDQIRAHGDTLGEMMNYAKLGLAEVCQKIGDHRRAAELYMEVVEINDTLRSRQAVVNAQQLAAVYHDREQQEQIARQRLWIAALTGIILLAAVVGLIYRIGVVRKRKNMAMAAIVRSLTPEPLPKEEDNVDQKRFQTFDDAVNLGRLYAKQEVTRDVLVSIMAVDSTTFSRIIREQSGCANLNEYLNRKRIDMACELIAVHDDWSMEAVAHDCGFSSVRTFNHVFKTLRGITPTEHLRQRQTIEK